MYTYVNEQTDRYAEAEVCISARYTHLRPEEFIYTHYASAVV